MSMMRVAVAGTGGLARLIAYYIEEETGHHVIFLSRTAQPQLTTYGHQVFVVNYHNRESLKYALRGIDTVISTVTGSSQIELIHAAVEVRVRRFAPAEFEGPPELRPANDPLDRSRTLARRWLMSYSNRIQWTTFVCGILYERFQPGGLRESKIGATSGFSGEGDYIVDIRNMQAQVPLRDAEGSHVSVCLTAAQDVGRFVTRAIDMVQWPVEMRMCGHRTTVRDLVYLVRQLTGREFNIQWHNPESLGHELRLAAAQRDVARVVKIQTLIATAESRYDFVQPYLNHAFPDVQPIKFREWFIAKWNLQM